MSVVADPEAANGGDSHSHSCCDSGRALSSLKSADGPLSISRAQSRHGRSSKGIDFSGRTYLGFYSHWCVISIHLKGVDLALSVRCARAQTYSRVQSSAVSSVSVILT